LEVLSGKPLGPENCWIDHNGDGQRDATTSGYTMEQVRAITNRADVLALYAAKVDAAKTQDVPLGKATLRTYEDGSIEINRPIIMLSSTNGTPAYGLIVTTDGDLVTYLDHASPRPSPGETQRRSAEAVDARVKARTKALAEVNGQLQARIENLERLLGLRK